MPVGTQGAVKAMTPRDLEDVGASIILGNTYHLMLRPGDELIARRGGLHTFIGWNTADPHRQRRLPGLQPCRTAGSSTKTGVTFRSHLDGSAHLLTPESAVDIQANLGSDIAMVLDECPALPSTPEVIDYALSSSRRDGPGDAATAFWLEDLSPEPQVPDPGAIWHRSGRHFRGVAREKRGTDCIHWV